MKEYIVTGEGPTDYGWKDYGTDNWHCGAASVLLKRILSEKSEEFKISFIDKDEYGKDNRPKYQRRIKGIEGRGIPCFFFLNGLKSKGYIGDTFVPVFYTDADKNPDKSHTDFSSCQKLYNEKCEEIETASKLADISCIPMVPMKMIECWLLADRNAIKEVLGCDVSKLPDKPELIWGEKNNPKSNYPKNCLARILKEANYGNTVEEKSITYIDIAENIDLKVLKEKCPISFADFYNRCINDIY